MELSIVIPVINEGANLKELLPRLHDVASRIAVDYEIILIDGGSTDDTCHVGNECGARVLQQQGRGYGRALRDGFAAAQGEYILTLDGDMSHHPDFIPDMWDKRNVAEIIIASRYTTGGSAEMTKLRILLSRSLNRFFTKGLSLPFHDISSGFRLYNASHIRHLHIESSNFDVLEEILIKSYTKGHKIIEVPFHYAQRKSGNSHVNLFMFGISYFKTFNRMRRLRKLSLSIDSEERIDATCIACGGKCHSLYAVKAGHKVWKCGTCATLFLYPLPKQSETKAVYCKEYFTGAQKGFGYIDYDTDKEAMRSVFERYLKEFERILGKTGRLLDIGAATGYFMKIAEERGWKTRGVEISTYATDIGRSRGLDIEAGTIQSTDFRKESFDVVTMWDVVEHVADPILDIDKAYLLLRPGGLLAINTPDSFSLFAKIMGPRWHLLVPPEHIFYFNRKSLKMMLRKRGFEILQVGCIGKRFTLQYFLSKTPLKFLKLPRAIGRIPIRINVKDNMYLLARKTL